MINKIFNENCLTGLKSLQDNSVDCCVTSPPYWALRNYDHKDQLGLEDTPEEFVKNLVAVLMEVHRVMKDTGTLWLNLGDSYSNGSMKNHGGERKDRDQSAMSGISRKPSGNLKSKDLVGIPWMVAFALRSAGWYLRQDIIWSKPNPMPESITDRCTKSHEYIFLLSKSANYYYNIEAIMEECSPATHARLSQNLQKQVGSTRGNGGQKPNGNMKAVGRKLAATGNGMVKNNEIFDAAMAIMPTHRNKRSVWSVTTQSFSEAHFATFPERLIVDCIKAGCPEGGIVLDPFMGAGTTALVARKLNRNYVGFELNQSYIEIAEKRLKDQLGMFL